MKTVLVGSVLFILAANTEVFAQQTRRVNVCSNAKAINAVKKAKDSLTKKWNTALLSKANSIGIGSCLNHELDELLNLPVAAPLRSEFCGVVLSFENKQDEVNFAKKLHDSARSNRPKPWIGFGYIPIDSDKTNAGFVLYENYVPLCTKTIGRIVAQ